MKMNQKKSKGAALIIFFLVLIAAGASVVLTKSNKAFIPSGEMATQKALVTAKAALIQYALTHPTLNGYGILPCPDVLDSGSEGNADGNCGDERQSALGYFPWRTLGTGALYDSSGECLWYAVSGNFKNHNYTMWNPDMDDVPDPTLDKGAFNLFAHDGTTQINGTSADGSDQIVALVIAPGGNIKNKNRTPKGSNDFCRPDYDANHFLESYQNIDNAAVSDTSGDSDDFIIGTTNTAKTGDLNDQIITITREDIYEEQAKTKKRLERMTEALALCIAKYGKNNLAGINDKRLPNPGIIDLTGSYRTDGSYTDIESDYLNFGRLPYNVENSAADTNNILKEMSHISLETLRDKLKNKLFSNCTNLTLTDGTNVNLSDSNNELRKAWKNWKYNVFYAVSKRNQTGESSNTKDCAHDDHDHCVVINDGSAYSAYAAIVLFGGEKTTGQIRRVASDPTYKEDVANFLEGSNNRTGDTDGRTYYDEDTELTTGSIYQNTIGNDILYCITENLDVIACP